MNDERYNGWTNRETWAAHLWITSSPELYTDCVKQEALFIQTTIQACADTVLSRDEPIHVVQYYVPMILDIGSLWRVNWDEVAAALAD